MGGPKKASPLNINLGNQLPRIGGVVPINLDLENPFGGIRRTLESGTELEPINKTEAELAEEARVGALNEKARTFGFVDEADRVKKVTSIINAFGKTRRRNAPAALSGSTRPADQVKV